MSSMKDAIKKKEKDDALRKGAHGQLIDDKVIVNGNVNVNKKKRFEDTHSRATVYIDNGLLDLLEGYSAAGKGEKTRIVNEALRAWFKAKEKATKKELEPSGPSSVQHNS